ncbi:MAG: aminomethyl-transferring glycine dehydrogenase subunit GcvPB [Candidatus Hydrogenedentota bacterium]
MKTIFELVQDKREPIDLTNIKDYFGKEFIRTDDINIPDITEREFVKHYTNLSQLNYCVDTNFYPLGSCTMKYNPKISEKIAKKEKLTSLHPSASDDDAQGVLEILYLMDKYLCELTGMDGFSFQPSAGAQGELTGMLIFAKYFKDKKEKRKIILIPDSSHGTNPASAALASFELATVKSDRSGNIDLEDLKSKLNDNVAGLMITNPNTLGLFDEHILEITELVHSSGGLLYYDGANFNAIIGYARPGDMGFDVVHLNLHKTFGTPHGGGGPGAGPCGCKDFLVKYLPGQRVIFKDNKYHKICSPETIGNISAFNGPIGVIVKAFCYIRSVGEEGLKEASFKAVTNANYLLEKLKNLLPPAIDRECMHEFVLSGERLKEKGVKTLDVAKRLLDFGFYAPTIYFPLIVPEAMMFEPTESETKETLDEFAKSFEQIMNEVETNPDLIKKAPHNTPVRRVDEVFAARNPVLRWNKELSPKPT